MLYILTENEIIQGIYDSLDIPENAIIVPYSFEGCLGDNIHFFNEDWTRKPLQQLVDEELITIPTGQKIFDNQFVPMSKVERIQAGLEELPTGMKIVDDLLMDMSFEEKLDAGLITETDSEYIDYKIAEYQSYLYETDWYAIRYADTGEKIPTEIKLKRQNAREQISLLRTNQ